MLCCSSGDLVLLAHLADEADGCAGRAACLMMSSRPANVPPQMNRMCVVSIWMYCCSGCLRPPWGGMLRDRAFEHLQQGLLHALAGDVAGDARRCWLVLPILSISSM